MITIDPKMVNIFLGRDQSHSNTNTSSVHSEIHM